MLKATIAAGLDLGWTENPEVKRLIAHLRPGLELPGREQLSTTVLQRCVGEANRVKAADVSRSAAGALSCSICCWLAQGHTRDDTSFSKQCRLHLLQATGAITFLFK